MPDPRYPQDPRYPRDPRDVRDPLNPRNPRHPLGGGLSELNPTRDHVQGEPEGTTPDANQHTRTGSGRTAPPPQNERDPYFYDPTFRP